jgi:hypothetical protein
MESGTRDSVLSVARNVDCQRIRSSFCHEPGMLVELITKQGVASVMRLALHGGLQFRTAGSETLIVSASAASVLWCAYYGEEVLANRWEPFDQSDPAAYMPLSYRALIKQPLAQGAFFVQRRAQRALIHRVTVDDGVSRVCEFAGYPPRIGVEKFLERFVAMMGVPDMNLTNCVNDLSQRLAQLALDLLASERPPRTDRRTCSPSV